MRTGLLPAPLQPKLRSPMRVSGVHHLAIKARDPARVAGFYSEVLGLEERDRHADAGGLRSIWLQTQDVLLMIERADTAALPAPEAPFEHDPPGLHLLALRIEAADRSDWRDLLERHGVPVAHESDYTLYVRDPEGNRVGLSTWPAPSRP